MRVPPNRIAAICLTLLILLTIPVALHINLPGDMALVRVAVGLRNNFITQVVGVLTFMGSALPALAICVALGMTDWLRDAQPANLNLRRVMEPHRVWRAAWPIVAYVGALITNIALRIIIGRLRPDVAYIPHAFPELQADFQRFSYPSGHAGATLVTFAALAIVIWRYPAARWPVLVACALIIVGVGFGRVYLGVHWPSDVLAGFLIGCVWLGLAVHLSQQSWFHKTS